MNKIDSIEHIWSIICSRSTIDSETNNLTLNNLIEKVAFTIPAAQVKKDQKGFVFPFEFEVTSFFRTKIVEKNEVFDLRIRIVNRDEKEISVSAIQKVVFKEGTKNIRIRNRFNALAVEAAGEHWFHIEIKDVAETEYVSVARIPMDVDIIIQ